MECRFKLLEDGRTLSHCTVQKEPTLYPQMPCTLSGYHIQKEPTLYLQMACTLSGYHIQMAITCVISMGKPLEDDRTLSDNNIHVIRALSFSPDEDNRTLSEHDIQKKTPLHLVLCLHVYIQISVKTLADETITLAVDTLDLIDKGKARFQDEEGIPSAHQCLIFDDKHLEDDRTLSECDARKGTPLHLVLRLSACMQIFGKPLADKAITLAVEVSDTIGYIRITFAVEASDTFDSVQATCQYKEGTQTPVKTSIFEAVKSSTDNISRI